MSPQRVNSQPLRALRVGSTQSNMSMPAPTASMMSSGVPMPMRYLGLSKGIFGATWPRMRERSAFGSPTDSPPMAYPSNPRSTSLMRDSSRKFSYMPPCTMPKRRLGLSNALFERSAQRIDSRMDRAA